MIEEREVSSSGIFRAAFLPDIVPISSDAVTLRIARRTQLVYQKSNTTTITMVFQSSDIPQQRSNVSTVVDLAQSRKKKEIIEFIESKDFLTSTSSLSDPIPVNSRSLERTKDFLLAIPNDRMLPKVLPDGEGDVMMYWGRPASLLITIEKDLIHSVRNPVSKREKQLSPVEYSGREIPREIFKYIPWR